MLLKRLQWSIIGQLSWPNLHKTWQVRSMVKQSANCKDMSMLDLVLVHVPNQVKFFPPSVPALYLHHSPGTPAITCIHFWISDHLFLIADISTTRQDRKKLKPDSCSEMEHNRGHHGYCCNKRVHLILTYLILRFHPWGTHPGLPSSSRVDHQPAGGWHHHQVVGCALWAPGSWGHFSSSWW